MTPTPDAPGWADVDWESHEADTPWQEAGEWHVVLVAGACGHRFILNSRLTITADTVGHARALFAGELCRDCRLAAETP